MTWSLYWENALLQLYKACIDPHKVSKHYVRTGFWKKNYKEKHVANDTNMLSIYKCVCDIVFFFFFLKLLLITTYHTNEDEQFQVTS